MRIALFILTIGLLSGCTTPEQSSKPGPFPDNYQKIATNFATDHFSNSETWKVVSAPRTVCVNRGLIKSGVLGAGLGNLSCYVVILAVEKKNTKGESNYDYYDLYIRNGELNGWHVGRNDHDVFGTLTEQ